MKRLIGFVLLSFIGVLRANLPVRDFRGEELGARPAAVFTNPALLGLVSRPVLEGGFVLRFLSEQRARFVYDQFENTVGEAVIADNIHADWVAGPISVMYPFGRFGAGAGVAPVADFNYTYEKEYRDEFYVKTGVDRVVQRGVLYSGNIGVAFKPLTFLRLGVGARYIFGDRDLKVWSIRIPDTVVWQRAERASGPGWYAGVVFVPVQRLNVGLGYQSAVRWAVFDSGPSARYPMRAVLGVNYRAAGVLPAFFSAAAVWSGWAGVDSGLRNVLGVRAEITHLMLNFVRLHYGFGVEPLFSDPMVHRAEALFGVGFDVGRCRIDLNARVNREELTARHFALPVVPDDVQVVQTRVLTGVGVSYEW